MIKGDDGDKAVEMLLRDTEQEIIKIYDEASKGCYAKLQKHLRAFQRKDAEKRKLLASGELSQDEYNRWKHGQIMIGQRWQDMVSVLAEDMVNADKLAVSVINGHIPEAYAVNANYGTYQIEHGLGIDTSFVLYDRHTVERLIRDDPDLYPAPNPEVDIPKDRRWNKRQINSQVTQAILQGEPVKTLAKRIFPEIAGKAGEGSTPKKNAIAAMRTARTAMTGAQNAGRVAAYSRAEELGIQMLQEWVSAHDGHTRESHLDVDGEQVPVGSEFSNECRFPGDPGGPPEEVYNCFIGETRIASDSEVVRSYCHKYSGELIEIKTAGGVRFTCTPNHPILSCSGWVSANTLNKGDNILVTRIGNDRSAGRNPYINHVFPRMDAFHKFFYKIGGKRTCALSVNFHGDIPASNVEVITQKRFLRKNRNFSVIEGIYKFLLKLSNKSFLSKSAFGKHFWSICLSAFCFVCGFGKSFAFFWRSLFHSQKHGFGTVTDVSVSMIESAINNASADVESFSEFLDGFSGEISTDNIISVNRIISERCHVYNLQTKNGYYFVNSSISQNAGKGNGKFAIAHNCRCTLIPVLKSLGQIKDENYKPSQRETDISAYKQDKTAHKMSFEEWMARRNGND